MSLLSAFNNLLEQFIQDMILSFPDLKELKTINTLVTSLRRINPRMVLFKFLRVAGKHHEKIFDEKASFFEDLDNWKKDPDFKEEASGNEDDLFQKLVVFKSIWGDLSQTNKNSIWIYFKQLLIIGAKANNNPMLQQMCDAIIIRAGKLMKK